MAEYQSGFPSSGRYAYQSPRPLRPSGSTGPAVSRPGTPTGRYPSVSPAVSTPGGGRPVQGTVRPVQSTRPIQGSSKSAAQGTPKTSVRPRMKRVPQYDAMDRGPEDRFQVPNGACQDWVQQIRSSEFDLYDPLITGVFIINGVNYAKYEYIKENKKALESFHEAIKSDIVSEIGNAVRSDDIVIKIFPGQIKTVVLHYNKGYRPVGVQGQAPQLVDAEWCMKVDYVIRARDVQRQQNVAMALYTAFSSDGFMASKTRAVYGKVIDTTCDITKVFVTRPVHPAPEAAKSQQPRLVSPQRGSVPFSQRSPSVPPPLPPQQIQQPLPPIPAPVPQQPPQQHPPTHTQLPPQLRQSSERPGSYQRTRSENPLPPYPTIDQIKEKDKQLEMLVSEIERERKALRDNHNLGGQFPDSFDSGGYTQQESIPRPLYHNQPSYGGQLQQQSPEPNLPMEKPYRQPLGSMNTNTLHMNQPAANYGKQVSQFTPSQVF